MTLLFMDGFDHYATADQGKKWTLVTGNTINAAAGRRGGGAGSFAAVTGYFRKDLGVQMATAIAGFAMKYASVTGSNNYFFNFFDTVGGNAQLYLRLNTSTNKIELVKPGGSLLGTSANALPTDVFNYIEIKATIHPSAGSVIVKVNGNTEINISGANTRSTANSWVDSVMLGDNGGSLSGTVDDFYICDTVGSIANDFLGDIRIDTLYPTSDGANQAWTPSSGTTHYTLVDDPTPNTTDYVSSDVVGAKDTYGMSDITHTPSAIFGAQVCVASLKNDAGARSMKVVTRSGGSDYSGPATSLSTSQNYVLRLHEADPATSAAWTKTNLNAAEFGAEVA
ncbi:hypothetical protein AU476_07565 [Cupriavidus sp. UYMSc13B]|nr:hypothetical protein AU476_07565 [Cupriavidus sp. UYMSc13B]